MLAPRPGFNDPRLPKNFGPDARFDPNAIRSDPEPLPLTRRPFTGQNQPPPQLPAFHPGQLGALSSQLNAGFGGGQDAWKQDLRMNSDPTPISNFNYGPDPKKPVKKTDHTGDGHNGHNGDHTGDTGDTGDSWGHDSAIRQFSPQMLPQAMQQRSAMPGLLAQPQQQGMMQQPPQMGGQQPMGMPPQMQMGAQGMQAGMQPGMMSNPSIPPQILAMLRAKLMGGQ